MGLRRLSENRYPALRELFPSPGLNMKRCFIKPQVQQYADYVAQCYYRGPFQVGGKGVVASGLPH